MDKILRPDRLELDPNTSVDGLHSHTFTHWTATFTNFLATLVDKVTTDEQKYSVLINHVSPDIYLHISSVSTYTEVMVKLLNSIFLLWRL